jgi:hypothetical protein
MKLLAGSAKRMLQADSPPPVGQRYRLAVPHRETLYRIAVSI